MAVSKCERVLVSPSTLSITEVGNLHLSCGCKIVSHSWFSSLLTDTVYLLFIHIYFHLSRAFSLTDSRSSLYSIAIPVIPLSILASILFIFCLFQLTFGLGLQSNSEIVDIFTLSSHSVYMHELDLHLFRSFLMLFGIRGLSH